MNQPSTALAQMSETPNNAKAENMRKAYRIDWDDFLLWCDLHGRQPMPATPETVLEYLESLADAGAKVATIKRRLSSISVAHQMRGHENANPTRSGLVTTSMQGIRRTLGTAQTQKAPLVTAELTRLVAACDQQSPLMAARNRALLLVGCSGGFRRS
jgi:site-specific recombinase XerD